MKRDTLGIVINILRLKARFFLLVDNPPTVIFRNVEKKI